MEPGPHGELAALVGGGTADEEGEPGPESVFAVEAPDVANGAEETGLDGVFGGGAVTAMEGEGVAEKAAEVAVMKLGPRFVTHPDHLAGEMGERAGPGVAGACDLSCGKGHGV